MEIDRYDHYVSDWVLAKLSIHGVTEQEVEEAFFNSSGVYVKEIRKEHRTRPPTYWFVSLSCEGRPLKVAFIAIHESKTLVLKTAYPAESWEVEEYENFAR